MITALWQRARPAYLPPDNTHEYSGKTLTGGGHAFDDNDPSARISLGVPWA
jgi:hypothetical protein